MVIAISTISCVGYDIKNKPQKQEIQILKNPLQLKDASIYFFDVSQLDNITNSCYINTHYYDYGQKFDSYINNNGNFGGNIFSIDGQNKNCAMLPYTNINNTFTRVSVLNSDIEDCADFRYCKLHNLGFNDNNQLLGNLTDRMIYYSLGNHFFIKNYNFPLVNSVKDTTDFNILVGGAYYGFPLSLINLSTGYNKDVSFYQDIISDTGYTDYFGNILYGNKGYIKINESKFYKLDKVFTFVSRNGDVFSQIRVDGINIYDSVNQIYKTLPFPTTIKKFSSYSYKFGMTDDKIISISVSTSDVGNFITYLINLNNGKWYDVRDLMNILGLSAYKSLTFQISPNGKYMLIDGTYDTKNVLAVKVSFQNGLADYMQNNLQPLP